MMLAQHGQLVTLLETCLQTSREVMTQCLRNTVLSGLDVLKIYVYCNVIFRLRFELDVFSEIINCVSNFIHFITPA